MSVITAVLVGLGVFVAVVVVVVKLAVSDKDLEGY